MKNLNSTINIIIE